MSIPGFDAEAALGAASQRYRSHIQANLIGHQYLWQAWPGFPVYCNHCGPGNLSWYCGNNVTVRDVLDQACCLHDYCGGACYDKTKKCPPTGVCTGSCDLDLLANAKNAKNPYPKPAACKPPWIWIDPRPCGLTSWGKFNIARSKVVGFYSWFSRRCPAGSKFDANPTAPCKVGHKPRDH